MLKIVWMTKALKNQGYVKSRKIDSAKVYFNKEIRKGAKYVK